MTDRDIYENSKDDLMRYAVSLVGPDDAHDLVAEAVAQTLRRQRLSELDDPMSYLMKAALNNARTRGRRQKVQARAMARLAAERFTPSSEPDLDVSRVVASLPIRQRAAIHLVYWEDLTPTQAAQLMGIRPATLRRYLHLAREKLRGLLDDS